MNALHGRLSRVGSKAIAVTLLDNGSAESACSALVRSWRIAGQELILGNGRGAAVCRLRRSGRDWTGRMTERFGSGLVRLRLDAPASAVGALLRRQAPTGSGYLARGAASNGHLAGSPLQQAILEFYEFQNQHFRPAPDRDESLTVVVTNWKREDFLRSCVHSVAASGIKNVVVVSFAASEASIAVHKELLLACPHIKAVLFEGDQGCNELWLQGLYQATTPYVLILHDDDELAPGFAACYQDVIRPQLEKGIGTVLWDARIKEGGRVTDEYHVLLPRRDGQRAVTGNYDPTEIMGVFRDPEQMVYPISPVVQILHTDVCKRALKECQSEFIDPVHFTRPTMMVGNEVLMTLRNFQAAAAGGRSVFYVHRALTYFGRHAGSESEISVQSGSDKFPRGLQASRNHFNRHFEPPNLPQRRLIHAVNLFAAKDAGTQRRNRLAMLTWRSHYEKGQVVFCPVHDSMLSRDSSSLGDSRRVSFVRDVIEAGLRVACAEDAVMITNSDICLSSDAVEKVLACIERHGCCFSFRRDFYEQLTEPVPDELIWQGAWYVGSDLFAFSRRWWETYGRMFPDFLIGKPCWDWIFRCLMGYSQMGSQVFELGLEEIGRVVECEDVIYHEKHESWAERPEIYHEDEANRHNFGLAFDWLNRYAGRTDVAGSEQIPRDLLTRPLTRAETTKPPPGSEPSRWT